MLRTMAVSDDVHFAVRIVFWNARRQDKRLFNRRFRRAFNRAVREGKVEAWSEFNAKKSYYLTSRWVC